MEFYIGQTFEDMYPSEAADWCNENNAEIVELDSIIKEAEEEVEEPEMIVVPETEIDGEIIPEHTETQMVKVTHLIEKTFRVWQIREVIDPEPTDEEQSEKRSRAYQQEVDPITSHIQRLRDKDPMPQEEIDMLIAEREAKVEEIKQRYPYSSDNS